MSATPSSSRRVSGDRAAITGERGVVSSGAPSGSAKPGKLDVAAGLAHDQLAGRASTPRHVRSVTIPSKRAAATWHSDDAIVPSARSR